MECCNIEKVKNALKSLGKEQLNVIIEEDERAEVVCPYCKKIYNFSKEELIKISLNLNNRGNTYG